MGFPHARHVPVALCYDCCSSLGRGLEEEQETRVLRRLHEEDMIALEEKHPPFTPSGLPRPHYEDEGRRRAMLEPHPRHTMHPHHVMDYSENGHEINCDCRFCRVADRDREALRKTGYVYDPDGYFPNHLRSSWNPILHLED